MPSFIIISYLKILISLIIKHYILAEEIFPIISPLKTHCNHNIDKDPVQVDVGILSWS